MDKRMKNLNKNIVNGTLLEESIPNMLNYMAEIYHYNAAVRLSMHYYAFYEAYCDHEKIWDKDVKELITRVNTLMNTNLFTGEKALTFDAIIGNIDEIRSNIMNRMKILAVYTDIFMIYEHILNRLEYHFIDNTQDVDNEEFAREILRYIFDSQDNVIINEKIKEIIGQLPVRMTKQRYYNIIEECFKNYLNANQSSLDTFLYMLRTSAMLEHVEGMETVYPDLWEQKEYLSKLKYKELTKDEFDNASATLKNVIKHLETDTSVYFSLQEVVNELYVIMLCKPYIGLEVSEAEDKNEVAFDIIKVINQYFMGGSLNSLPIELVEKFAFIEGVQEDLAFDIASLEDGLNVIDISYRDLAGSLMVEKLLNVLLLCSKLFSNSLFIELHEACKDTVVTEEMLEEQKNKLIHELANLFETHDRVIGRAVMANTINKVPVFFIDHKEVMDYVLYSIDRCSDPKEKMAYVEIIKQIMSE